MLIYRQISKQGARKMHATTIKTSKREYVTATQLGIWTSSYRPINPETGFAWQASRSITKGHDCYVLTNWRTGETSGAVMGAAPSISEWSAQGMESCISGFSTEAMALEAIAKDRSRTEK